MTEPALTVNVPITTDGPLKGSTLICTVEPGIIRENVKLGTSVESTVKSGCRTLFAAVTTACNWNGTSGPVELSMPIKTQAVPLKIASAFHAEKCGTFPT